MAATPTPEEDSCCDPEVRGACDTPGQTPSLPEKPRQGGLSETCCLGLVTRELDEAVVRDSCGSNPKQGCFAVPTVPGTDVLGSPICGDMKTRPCCAPEVKAPEEVVDTSHNGCQDRADEADFSASEPTECNSSTGCCSAQKQPKMKGGDTSCYDDGASPSSTIEYANADCNEGCCLEPGPPKTEDPDNPSCCEAKTSPCCDEACLDRIALRECDVSSGILLPAPFKRRENPQLTLHYRHHYPGRGHQMQRARDWETMCETHSCGSRQVCHHAERNRVYLPRAPGTRARILLSA
ncbi:hypothetical protein IMZ48_08675 [Candidatus Bathyarchaeota archaeon]|nr:hypothetical protein [Candidatus Bathyarchaeota archaeon]